MMASKSLSTTSPCRILLGSAFNRIPRHGGVLSKALAHDMTASLQREEIRNTATKQEQLLKPFSSVPAPPRLPLIGHAHLFSKFGPYSFRLLYEAYSDIYKRYGPIVRLDLGIKMLLLFRPEDIARMHHMGDALPARPIFEALKHYRRKRSDIYPSAGLTSENGEEWWRLRREAQFIMHPDFAPSFFHLQEQIANDFVDEIRKKRNSEGFIPDFIKEIYKYTEEAVGVVCFGERLGILGQQQSKSHISKQLTKAADDTMAGLADTLLGFPWWKIFPTPAYKRLIRSQDFFQTFAARCIEEAKTKLKDPNYINDGSLELLKRLLENKNLAPNDISLIMTELFSAGIDATGNAIGFLLYNLARNPDVQEKLYEEIQELNKRGINATALNQMPYLKACFKESSRLTPATGGTARITDYPTEFSGYLVPKGVLCIGLQPIASRQEEFFPDPMEYKPERYLRENVRKLHCKHQYCVMPFSIGLRSCIGRRFAEQEIHLCIFKIIQAFKLEYEGPEIGTVMRLSLLPDKPLNFKFTPRT